MALRRRASKPPMTRSGSGKVTANRTAPGADTSPGAMPEQGKPVWFGDYLLIDLIAAGGMAHVFRGLTFGVEGFARQVAIKRILPQWAKDKNFINMLVDEARIAVALSHSGIVQTYELGEVDGRYYIAMEYVAGIDLRQMLNDLLEKGERLPLPLAAFVVSSVCSALDHAHRRHDLEGKSLSIVHRDVSPHNVLLGYNGEVKVTDFGIASAEDRVTQTRTGALKGKFAYMAPEQVRGLPVTRASDIFAIGALLFELVTGHQLFEGDSDFAVLEHVRNAEFTPPRELEPDVPEEVEEIILKALEAAPEDRYAWASDMEEALQPLLIDDRSIVGRGRLATFLLRQYPDAAAEESSISDEILAAALGKTEDMDLTEMPTRISGKQPRTQLLATKSGWEHIDAGDALLDTQETAPVADTRAATHSAAHPAPHPASHTVPHGATAPSTSGTARTVSVVAVLVALAAVVVSGVLWTQLQDTSTPDAQPPPVEPATLTNPPPPANTASETRPDPAGATDGAEQSDVEEPAEAVSPKQRLANLRRAIDKSVRRHGIIPGDLPPFDANRVKMNQATKRGNIADAVAAAERAATALRRFSLDKSFLYKKLGRFNKRFDKTKDAALRKRLSAQASKIGVAISASELREANRQLNAAFRMLGD